MRFRMMLAKSSDAPYLEGFVRFNPVPVPNWAGHALIAGLMAVFPPLFAEKVHWALLVLALASGGHRMVRAWSGMTDARTLLLLPDTHEEALLILAERADAPPADLAAQITAAIVARTGIRPHTVAVLEPGTLPRTSSGKLRRAEALRLFLARSIGWMRWPLPQPRRS